MDSRKRSFPVALKIFIVALGVGVASMGVRYWLSEGRRIIHPPSVGQVPLTVASMTPISKNQKSPPVFLFKESNEVKDRLKKWQAFKQKFGSDLEPQFNSKGQLVSVRGALGQGHPAAHDFRTGDLQKVTLRGQEILKEAQELLGLRAELPLSSPIPRSGPVTAQLYFKETYRGMALLPEGSLKIDLGPQGELLELYSGYLPKINVVYDGRLSAEDAWVRALASVNRDKASLFPNSGGLKVVWMSQATQGHVAYQFFIRGHEIVIDAANGEVLSSRDRKQQ
jgi:hypothetical protein